MNLLCFTAIHYEDTGKPNDTQVVMKHQIRKRDASRVESSHAQIPVHLDAVKSNPAPSEQHRQPHKTQQKQEDAAASADAANADAASADAAKPDAAAFDTGKPIVFSADPKLQDEPYSFDDIFDPELRPRGFSATWMSMLELQCN